MSQTEYPSDLAIAAARVAMGKSRGRPSEALINKAIEIQRSGNIKQQLVYDDDTLEDNVLSNDKRSYKRTRKNIMIPTSNQVPLAVSTIILLHYYFMFIHIYILRIAGTHRCLRYHQQTPRSRRHGPRRYAAPADQEPHWRPTRGTKIYYSYLLTIIPEP